MTEYKSSTQGELIPAIVVEFKYWPDYYWTLNQWKGIGGYKGFLTSQNIPISEIKKVHKLLLNPEQFPTNEWEP